MYYYADEKAIKEMGEIANLARQVIERTEAAITSAQKVMVVAPGLPRDGAQSDYDSHHAWVCKLAEDLHTATKNLP